MKGLDETDKYDLALGLLGYGSLIILHIVYLKYLHYITYLYNYK